MRISDWSSDVCSSDLGKDKGTVFRGRLLVVALAYLLSGAAWLSLPPIAHAQSILSGGRIADIRVEGTQRIEAATVRLYMRDRKSVGEGKRGEVRVDMGGPCS